MEAKEKAIELVEKYLPLTNVFHEGKGFENDIKSAKKAALIAVEEIINIPFEIRCDASERCVMPHIDFYLSVKAEIEKM